MGVNLQSAIESLLRPRKVQIADSHNFRPKHELVLNEMFGKLSLGASFRPLTLALPEPVAQSEPDYF